MATYPIRQLTSMQRLMGGAGLVRAHGDQKWTKTGPIETVNLTPNITVQPVYSNEWGDRRLLRNMTTTKEATLELTGIQMWTEWLYEALFMSNHKYKTQSAVVSATLEVEDVAAGTVVTLPGINGTITAIDDGASGDPVEYTENVDFIFHPSTGTIEFLKVPAGAAADATVRYSLPAVTETAGLLDLEIMENSGWRGEFIYIGVTKDGNGTEVKMHLPDVEFRPNGAIATGDTANPNVGGLTGSVYSTPDKGYGTIEGLAKIVNA
ncbi:MULTISPECIES: hypothetical protein [Rhizobium]|uniref:hypothetical protein n=1 Tax=Rhizobium TaxID=379 RepID=UPI0011462E6F|nr:MULTISPECIES: hypothetical protein [Rhizobium]UFS81562.1 hypothetical protein LPB79_25150 [Rhizobium sp. T136]